MHVTAFARPLRRVPALAAAVAAVLLASLAAASPAAAHDQLVASDPAADATVETLPTELTLTYSAELIDAPDGTAVEVLSPSGTDVTAGAPAIDGAMLTVPLAEAAEAGVYTVTWQVVSSDGHATDGTFSFTVATPTTPSAMPEPTRTPHATAPAQEPSATPSAVATDDPAEGTPGDGDAFARALPWIVAGLLLAGGGGALVAVLAARGRRSSGDGDATRTPPTER